MALLSRTLHTPVRTRALQLWGYSGAEVIKLATLSHASSWPTLALWDFPCNHYLGREAALLLQAAAAWQAQECFAGTMRHQRQGELWL